MNGHRRWIIMVAALVALAILVATPIWMAVKVADQNDRLAAADKAQTEQVARNRDLVDRLERQRLAEDAGQAAATLEICRKTNYALKWSRERIAADEAALINVLRMSPHSAAIADQVEASLPPMPTAEATDSDCNGDGQLTAEDYANG